MVLLRLWDLSEYKKIIWNASKVPKVQGGSLRQVMIPLSNFNKTKSFIMFYQNVRGLLKPEELISFLSPDFPQLLCWTEHHLKCTEIDFIYMDQYKLGTKFCRESLKNGGVSIFVHDTFQCTNINLDEFCKEQDTEACAVRLILSYLTICIISIDHQREIFHIS